MLKESVDETVWLRQKKMAELFGKAKNTITQYIKNISKETELEQITVCWNFLHTANDCKSYEVMYCNLDIPNF